MNTELHVPSDLKVLPVVEAWVAETLEVELKHQDGWKQLASKLRLVVVEAYSNVVRHAHKNQPHVPVVLRLELEPQTISLEIWDSGDGYDTSAYRPPEPEDFQEGGYGWMILSQLMDTVTYELQAQEGRNCLKLTIQTTNLDLPA